MKQFATLTKGGLTNLIKKENDRIHFSPVRFGSFLAHPGNTIIVHRRNIHNAFA